MGIQIDVLRIENNTAVCNLYTGNRCVRIVMRQDAYDDLNREGFFIRPGDSLDSAGVLNTTGEYKEPSKKGNKKLIGQKYCGIIVRPIG